MAKKTTPANKRKRVAVLAAGVGVLALAGGVAAQFTATTTSAPQSIGTGTVAIDLTNESAGWVAGINNLAAGDHAVTNVKFENKGTIALDDSVTIKAAISATATDAQHVALTEGTNPLKLKITAGGLDGKVGGANAADDVVVFDGAVKDLGTTTFSAAALQLQAGGVTDLTFDYLVPAAAGNEYQGQNATITYTVDAVQRDAGTFTNVSPNGSLTGN